MVIEVLNPRPRVGLCVRIGLPIHHIGNLLHLSFQDLVWCLISVEIQMVRRLSGVIQLIIARDMRPVMCLYVKVILGSSHLSHFNIN